MLKRWMPWKFILRRLSRSYGFPDPFGFLARLRRFSQPSEFQAPVELLRAAMVFHVRGFINTRAIQNNLDWVWPFWVERQFNPGDVSFVPRAYSLTHVNLTQRNWTAVGRPDLPLYPLVDPRGLVTPLYDGWSLDFWIGGKGGPWLLPSRVSRVEQSLEFAPSMTVRTCCREKGLKIDSRLHLDRDGGRPVALVRVTGTCDRPSYLAVSLRPYNPEGIQFVETISYDGETRTWFVNSEVPVRFSEAPEKVLFSNYVMGDVLHQVLENEKTACGSPLVECKAGMATAAALFPLSGNESREITLRIPLEGNMKGLPPPEESGPLSWESVLDGTARLRVPDARMGFLYEAAVRTLVLLSAGDVFPGPYTYRRFWFRDGCLMINALLSAGFRERCFRLLNGFPRRQDRSGYFKSQEGEWDSNGQVLWVFDRYARMTGDPLPGKWVDGALKGARWITEKRTPRDESLHGGLLPAGFSAEHLGPNDYYYWDDFWGLAGLQAAARIARRFRTKKEEQALLAEAADLEKSLFSSIDRIPERRRRGGIPASPYRRMDSGAVGSLVADYPLQILPPGNRAVARTVDFLMTRCFHEGGFFQDMIHSGVNAYLTLSIAQTLLRNDDPRYANLLETVADLASPTGQWPEAIHPRTRGGCMGDGQHGWAAAEWVQLVRNLFVREEGEKLILGSGLLPSWIGAKEEIAYGPAPTPFGNVDFRLFWRDGRPVVHIQALWRESPPAVEVRLPGFRPEHPDRFSGTCVLENLQALEDRHGGKD